jgi:DMSO/TMAO reductase YedYZ molybdopterin-dependent catalytic subunit
VDVIAKDGYTVTFDSKRVARNKNIIVAHTVNGNPLDEKYFPLRLVGSDLQKNEMVGAITEIKVGVEPVPTAAPTAAAEAALAQPGSLVITGMVNQTLTLNESVLRALKVTKIDAVHPKNGPMQFEGVLLNTLLDMAGVKDGAKTLVITAADGYTAEVDLAEARDCPKNMVAFTDTPGSFYMVMPDQPGSNWVKDVVKIELK